MASEPKRRKIEQLQSRRSLNSPYASAKEDRPVQVGKTMDVIKLRIEEGKNEAIAQAQRDGCTGNYRIFDSPFGNYFVPVIPTRNDLSSS